MSSRRARWERERQLQTTCLLIITCILSGAAVYWMSTVLIPFVLALFIFQLLDPIVNWMTRTVRLPHALAVSVTLILTAFILWFASSLITSSIGQILQSSDLYAERLDNFANHIYERFPLMKDRFQVIAQTQIEQLGEGVGSFLAAMTNSLIYVLSQSTIVILFLMFLLFGSRSADQPLPPVFNDISRKVRRYVQVKTALSLVNGAIVGVILSVLHIELAMVFGLLTALLNFIPNVGSIIATLLPLPMVLFASDVSQPEAFLAILLPGIIHFFIGNILEPKLLGNTMDLSPVVVLLSLTVWTALWGGIGALLAVPITAIIQILCQQLDFTRPIAEVLRGNFLQLLGTYHKSPENLAGEKQNPPDSKKISPDLQDLV